MKTGKEGLGVFMKTLPANLILEKNKLATPSAWLVLLKITLPDNTVLRLVNNTEDIVYQANTYTAINFNLESTKSSGTGQIPTVQLSISNVTRIIQAYLENLDGAVDSEVLLTVVNSAYLAENYAELEMLFSVLSTKANAQYVTFELGAPNPLRKRFPQYLFIGNHCNWRFLFAECAYAGWKASNPQLVDDLLIPLDGSGIEYGYKYKCTTAGTTKSAPQPTGFATGDTTVTDNSVVWTKIGVQSCKRTLNECEKLNNTERFGGFPGLGAGNVRFA